MPNTVTILRCVLAIWVGYLILEFGRHLDAGREAGYWVFIPFVAFVIIGATDWVDGALARGLDAVSPLGARLDPIADKLLTGACLLTLAHLDSWTWMVSIPALVIVGRDLLMTAIRESLGNPKNLKVTSAAKWKTAVVLVAIGACLLGMAISELAHYAERFSPAWIATRTVLMAGIVGIWVAAFLSVVTAVDYISALRRQDN
ncbi:CDP-alcohol phosphatidyltransferase family protein [Henriciella sp. AS95]|uniref:CDP-alcohol phosphatidyltransferase family protein n=1 Tax=Henriciella sp. AS95 TaxID=3135782 RepID=UPI0031813726